MPSALRSTSCLLLALLMAACSRHVPDPAAPTGSEHGPPEADRQAILAMAGEFRVTFRFDEVLPLLPDHAPGPPYHSAGNELVLVLEDRPGRIVLQHLLVSDRGHVTKHWRQDWTWEPVRAWEYAGHYTWRQRPLKAGEGAGRWLQTVWQVDDSPRYAGLGQWEHRGTVSRWTSDTTWRPLPRREHTRRSDYDVLVGINRHTITPSGWQHDQYNDKLRLADPGRGLPEQVLVHEVGTNVYRRVTDVDFDPARRYWARTSLYWQAVREAWEAVLAEHQRVQLIWDRGEVDPPHYMVLLRQANELDDHGPDLASRRALVRDTLPGLMRLDHQVRER